VNDERNLLIATADRLFASIAGARGAPHTTSIVWRGGDWAAVEEAGLTLALVPEDKGGFGIAMLDALLVVRSVGMFALPLPLPETMIANWLLSKAGITPRSGVALSIATGHRNDQLRIARAGDGSGWHVSGILHRVPWARYVDGVVALSDDGHRLAQIPRSRFQVKEGENLAAEPRDTITVDAFLDSSDIGTLASVDRTYIRRAGAAMRSIAIAGALTRLLEMTTQYAVDRVQFGKPIGKLQVIQQYLAVVAGQVAAAGAAANIAAEALATTLSPLHVAIAKVRTAEAVGVAASIAHQVHGAIGITQEYGLHQITRRLWSWRDEFGGDVEWAKIIGRQVIAAGGDGMWPMATNI
jgi:acyl-CoA dehydrogenase